MNKLILGFSGKKSSGKSSCSKAVIAYYINTIINQERFIVHKQGKKTLFVDTFTDKTMDVDQPGKDSDSLAKAYSVKIYSFADPLKSFLIDVMGFRLPYFLRISFDKLLPDCLLFTA